VCEARYHGYAEVDVSADLDGHDAAAKLAILCRLAFGLRVDPAQIAVRSTRAIDVDDFARAKEHGATIRQIAFADYDPAAAGLTAWVAPIEVDRSSIFARTHGPQNAAVITGAYCGDVGIFGAGAGGDATAVAVIGDVRAIARDKHALVPAPTLTSEFKILNPLLLEAS
jgi:homoserine dehydrogenase